MRSFYTKPLQFIERFFFPYMCGERVVFYPFSLSKCCAFAAMIPAGLELNPLGFGEGACNLVLTGVSPVRVYPERTCPFGASD